MGRIANRMEVGLTGEQVCPRRPARFRGRMLSLLITCAGINSMRALVFPAPAQVPTVRAAQNKCRSRARTGS
jgi:hypothetical protein